MRIEHFTKANLMELPSCFIDPKGNIISNGSRNWQEIGVHEVLATEIVEDLYGEDFLLDNYDEVYKNRCYTYEYVEEVLHYFRYSHWVRDHGVFNGEKAYMTHAQKLAIRAFCQANETTWERVCE